MQQNPPIGARPAPAFHRRKAGRWVAFKERAIEKTVQISGGTTIILVLLIFAFLLKDSLPSLKAASAGDMLLGTKWYPLSDVYGMVPLILGSVAVTFGAVLIGAPLGVAAAIYIGEVANPKAREILKPAVETLAAFPSVVVGFIGLALVVPWVKATFHLASGMTALTGSLMLAFMALPTIISISEDALQAVPKEFRAGSLALGASKLQTIFGVVVPAARRGMMAAVMLGVGRAIGETMTVLMVTGNAALIPHSLTQPVRTMTATIAAEMGELVHFSPHYHVLFAVGAVLFIMTFLVNLVADLFLHRGKR
jgi:phosphate transport system permease protein